MCAELVKRTVTCMSCLHRWSLYTHENWVLPQILGRVFHVSLERAYSLFRAEWVS